MPCSGPEIGVWSWVEKWPELFDDKLNVKKWQNNNSWSLVICREPNALCCTYLESVCILECIKVYVEYIVHGEIQPFQMMQGAECISGGLGECIVVHVEVGQGVHHGVEIFLGYVGDVVVGEVENLKYGEDECMYREEMSRRRRYPRK